MEDILFRLKQLQLNRISNKIERLKHNQGMHDQREHGNWSKGPGMYGGEVYIPNGRRESVMNSLQQNRQNVFGTNIAFSDDARFKKSQERNKSRLDDGFDITSYRDSMSRVSEGASGVKTFKIDGKSHFYRGTPIYPGSYRGNRNPDLSMAQQELNKFWFPMPSYYMPLVADSISTAMGIDIAPVAQLTKQGRVISNQVDIQGVDAATRIRDLLDAYNDDSSQENYDAYISALEPHIVMTLLTGNVDIKPENLVVIDDKIASVDYDYTGRNPKITGKYENREPVLHDYFQTVMTHNKDTDNKDLLTDDMSSMLENIRDGEIDWNPNITEFARKQMINRVNSLLKLSKNFVNEQTQFSVDSVVSDFTDTMYNESMQELRDNSNQQHVRDNIVNLQNWANKIQKTLFYYFKNNFDDLVTAMASDYVGAKDVVEQVYGIDYDTLIQDSDDLQQEIMDFTTEVYTNPDLLNDRDEFDKQKNELMKKIQSSSILKNNDEFYSVVKRKVRGR